MARRSEDPLRECVPTAARREEGIEIGDHPLPYVYVGPWNASDDPFWNAGTYARLGYQELVGDSDPGATALAFFARGYEVVPSAP